MRDEKPAAEKLSHAEFNYQHLLVTARELSILLTFHTRITASLRRRQIPNRFGGLVLSIQAEGISFGSKRIKIHPCEDI